MKLSVLIQIATSIASVAASTTFYPFTGDLYAYGDLRLRKISNNEPYQLGGSAGHVVSLTLGDDGTLKDSDGDYVYFDESSKSQFIYPSVNGTVLTGWGISSGQLTYKGANTWTACPIDDLHATFASGLSNCNQDNILVPQQLIIDASITAEEYDAAPRFTLHANGTGLGDGFLKISNLAPYGYSIGEGDEVATFTLLPNHKVFDQNDFVTVNNYGGYAQPLGEIVRYGQADANAKTTFVLTSDKKYLYSSTQPNDPLNDSAFIIESSWYLCQNGSTPFVSFSPQCTEEINTALDPPPTLMLELNYTGGSDTSSLSVPSSGSATIPSSSATSSATGTKTGESSKTGDSTNTGAATTPSTATSATAKPTTGKTDDTNPPTSITGATASPTTSGSSESTSSASAFASAYALAVASGKSGVSASAYAYAYAAAVSCGNGSASAYAYAEAFASSFTSGSYAYAEAYAYAYAQCGYVQPPTYETVTVTIGAEATATGEICYCKGHSTITTYVPLPTTTVYTEVCEESTTVVTTTCWPVVDSTSTYYPLIAPTTTVTVSPVSTTGLSSVEATSISTYENNAAGQVASFGAVMAGVALAMM